MGLTTQMDLARLQDRVLTSYSYSANSAADAAMTSIFATFSHQRPGIASSLAASAVVRMAADPALRDRLQPRRSSTTDESDRTETAEQGIAAASLDQLTGGQPEGWRWLLFTEEGQKTLILIMTVVTMFFQVASFVQDYVNNLEDDQSTVEVDNSPGSTINFAPSPDGDDQPSVSVKDSPGATVNVAPSPDEGERRDVPPETCGP